MIAGLFTNCTFSTDYLRTFSAVADTKGFTRADNQVNRSQSAVSMQIKRLEDEVDKPLFERIGKTGKLNASCQTPIRPNSLYTFPSSCID
jgi:hypothetical protein